MNESCHAYEWVVSHTWIRHTTRVRLESRFYITCKYVMLHNCYTIESVMLHINESCHVWMNRLTRQWVVSHLACHTYEWVMSRMNMNESCHMYQWVMSHVWMSQVASMNESCLVWISHVAYERVVSHLNESWSHVTHEWVVSHESCHTYEWVMSHIWMNHVAYERVVSRLNGSCHTWLGRLTRVMSHIWMSHVTHMNESCHTSIWVMSHIWMSHVTYMNVSCQIYP